MVTLDFSIISNVVMEILPILKIAYNLMSNVFNLLCHVNASTPIILAILDKDRHNKVA